LATQLPSLGPPPGTRAAPLAGPRSIPAGPSISLVNDPLPVGATGPIVVPEGYGYQPGGYGYPIEVGPGAVPGIPSVGPAGPCPGAGCPTPDLDAPLYGGGARHGFPALNRLLGCGTDRWWASGEYLLWWTRSTQLPVQAATGPLPVPGGVITTPVPIFSGSFGETLHSGGRFGGGWWFDDNQCRGIDGRFFFLGRNGSSFTTNSATFPVLGRPFFNPNPIDLGNGVTVPAGPLTDVIGAPGQFAGGVSVQLENTLWGAEANFRRRLWGTGCSRLDGLVGYRYLNFNETLTVTEAGVILDPTLLAAGRAPFASVTDKFRTTNDFHGGQVGLTGEVRRGRWFAETRASIAFGTVFQRAEIGGSQLQGFPDGRVAQFQGGLLAQPGANIGTFGRDRFAVLPEVGVNVGYHVTNHCRVFVGYNFLYLSSVLRPANVIDPVVDAARVPNFLPGGAAPLPGTPRPAPQLNGTDFFAQGVSFGVQWTW
ncbi:MAG: BBP7 family outer membrane beta-barrel protein, partial [Gemmataceae bacterium]|nr:BBP7 family outer membrane beta-barrel protein [Gemmataceae bacterium]